MDQTYGDRAVGTTDRTIVAMFEDFATADRARMLLERSGIPPTSIACHQSGGTDAASHDDESWWTAIKRLFVPDDDAHTYREGIRRGGAVLVVHVEPAQNDRVIDLLEQSGSVDVDQRAQEWRKQGWTPDTATAGAPVTTGEQPEAPRSGETRIPIAREELRVGKRDVSAGHVHVRAYTVERPVQEQVSLRHEGVEIERRPASGKGASVAGDPFQERTLDLEETREEAVVSKDARVDEELVVRKTTEQEQKTVSDKVRETRVEVDDQRGRSRG